jgi:glycosyltransferase involved in cell wall biosynthesis
MKLSVVTPAYKEGRKLEKTVDRYLSFFSSNREFEIIIVTDGCVDETSIMAEKLAKESPRVKHMNFPKKLGKGGAIIRGIKISSGDLIGFMDADGSISPEEFNRLVKEIGDYDGVIGSRWLSGSRATNLPLPRKFWSRVLNLAVKALFGLWFEDTQCGAKVFKGDAVRSVTDEIQTKGFAFDVDLLYRLKRKNSRVKEIPITWRHMKGSSVDLKVNVLSIALSVIRLRMLTSPLRRLGKSIFSLTILKRLTRE